MPEFTSLGKLFVEIGARLDDLDKGLKEADKKVKDFDKKVTVTAAGVGKAFALVGSTISGALALALRQTVVYGNEINTLSERTGIATEQLSKFKFIAEQTNTSFEALSDGFRFLSRNLFQANEEQGKFSAIFKALGVDIKDVNGNLLKADEVFLRLADRFSRITNDTTKSALAMEIFGRNGQALIPVLNLGRDGIERLSARAEELGLVLSGENAKAIADFDSKLGELKAVVGAASLAIGQSLIPILKTAVEFITNQVIPVVQGMNAAFVETGKILSDRQLEDTFKSADPVLENARLELVRLQEEIDRTRESIRNLGSAGGRGSGGIEVLEKRIEDLQGQEARVRDLIIERMQKQVDVQVELIQAEEEEERIKQESELQDQLRFEDFKSRTAEKVRALFEANNATLDFARSIITLGNSVESSFSNALSGLITGELTAKKAAEQLGQALVKAIADFIAQQIIAQTIGKALRAIELAAVQFFAAAVGQAWAVPAALAATATAGGAAAAGGTALSGVVALSKGLATLGFEKGSPNVPALGGITHPGEIVVTKTFADGIRSGELTLGGPNGGQKELRIEKVEVNVNGSVDEKLVPSLIEQIGNEFEKKLRGAT